MGTLYEDTCTFIIISCRICLKMRNVADKSCTENQNTHCMCNNFFPKIVPFMTFPLSFLSALQPWVSLGLLDNQSPLLSVSFRGWLLGFGTNYFYGVGLSAQPPTWRTRVSLFVWVITLDLSGMRGPSSSIRYRQHSSQVPFVTYCGKIW
jgi:hypothetical protein